MSPFSPRWLKPLEDVTADRQPHRKNRKKTMTKMAYTTIHAVVVIVFAMAALKPLLLVCWAIGTAAVALAASSESVDGVRNALLADPAHLQPGTKTVTAAPGRRLQQDAGTEPAGGAKEAEHEAKRAKTARWIYIHAVWMSLSWVGLLPLGILIARSRYAKPLRKPAMGKKVWFWLHMSINLSAVALVIAAYAAATSDSTGMQIEESDGSVPLAHKAIGSIAFALLLLQTVAAFIRPHPHAALRTVWNAAHHNLGRLAILVAWTAIWLGVTIGHDELPGSWARWLAPLAAAQGVILLLYLLNQGLKKRTLREEPTEEKKHHAQADRQNDSMVATAGTVAGSTAV